MLRYTTLGSKILLGLFFALAAAAAYLPFLEAFALTPAIAFIHRFSITLDLGGTTKTLQPIVFVIPILFFKAVWEYHKKYNLGTLLKAPLTKILLAIVVIDVVSILTSTSKSTSIGLFITQGMNLAVFITSSIWLKFVSDMIGKENLKKTGLRLLKTFAIALAMFTVVNTIVSITQFADCSATGTGCHIWKSIDETFPNKLLVVGHQKFSYKPIVIRAPGFFGDVNFNGMYSLFIVLIFGTLLGVSYLLKSEKGYSPAKEQQLLLIPIIAGLISFLLTLSRSAILGAGVTGLVLLFIIFLPIIRSMNSSKQFFVQIAKITGGIVLTIGLVFALGYLVPLTYKNRKTTISKEIVTYVSEMFSPDEDSAKGHAKLFASALKIGNQRPLTGMGMGTFGTQYEKIVAPGGGTNASPHSTYGLLYAEQGLLGVTTFLLIIGYLWYSSARAVSKVVFDLLSAKKGEKKLTREFYYHFGAQLFLALLTFGIPFFSVATVSYYGFFLPMTWWWGNPRLLENN